MNACTVVTRAGLPAARVLATSFLRHHPDGRCSALVIDDVDEQVVGESEPFDLVRPSALGLPRGELELLAMLHDETGLARALTPWLLCRLLDDGASSVLVLDPRTEVFAPLDDVGALAEEHGILLTPRCEQPPPGDGLDPTEVALLAAGAMAPGFLAVSAPAKPFLDWWRERFGPQAPGAPSAIDDRWLDLVPAAFPVHVLRDPTCQVSCWNLHCRALTRGEHRYEVGGRPIRTFEFGGFAPDDPQLLCPSSARRPRVLLSDRPALLLLCREYGARLSGHGYGQKEPPYGYGSLRDGSVIDRRMRVLYREGLLAASSGSGDRPPNPFARDCADAFVAWLNEPVFPPLRPVVSRYLARLWLDSADLRQRFPTLVGRTVDLYLEWLLVVGGEERDVPPCVRPTPEVVDRVTRTHRAQRPRAAATPGVNLVGYLEAVSGMGEVARLLVGALRRAGVAVAPVTHRETISAQAVAFDSVPSAEACHDVNLLCVNAAQTAGVADQLGPEFFAGRRTIGLWFWEVEEFQIPTHAALDLVDEVWVASDFTASAVARVCDKPVHTVPIPVGASDPSARLSRRELGLPERRHLFLYSFDFLSVPARKNPVGVVEAFTRAFRPDEGPVLVLKSINGNERIGALEAVREAAAGRSDVIVADGYLPPEHHASLLASCNTYVSLHRSEGYGLTIAEAMAMGKPVIATGYSGNLAFMDDEDGYLVEHEMRSVGPGCDPYPADGQWAEPDRDHAAALLRRVVHQPDEAAERGRRAAERLRGLRSVEATGANLATAVERARRSPAPAATWRRFFMRGWRVRPVDEVVRRYQYDWLPDGTPVDAAVHRLLAAGGANHGGRTQAPPDPEAPGGSAALVEWLNVPLFPRRWPVVSRYLYEYWRGRSEIRERFPDLAKEPAAFLRWVVGDGWDATDVPYALLPSPDVIASADRISAGGHPAGVRGWAYVALRAGYRGLRRARDRAVRGREGRGQ